MRSYYLIPLFVIITIAVIEILLWVNYPYGFLHARGVHEPNVDYHAMTVGDLVPEDPFVTPVPRWSRYVTDENGARNVLHDKTVDILMVGDSYIWGAGNSHEHTPAAQLEEISGMTVRVASSEDGKYPYERIRDVILDGDEYSPDIILYGIVDHSLWESVWETDDFLVNDVSDNEESYLGSVYSDFGRFKKYYEINSPMAIISRKLKSYVKLEIKKILYKFRGHTVEKAIHKYPGKYWKRGRVIYGFRSLPGWVYDYPSDHVQIDKIVEVVRDLIVLGKERDILVLPLLIPNKTIVYNNHYMSNKIVGYGPMQLLKDQFEQESIQNIFLHPFVFSAVESEMLAGGNSPYWSDDTHWNGYGVNVSMHVINDVLNSLGVKK